MSTAASIAVVTGASGGIGRAVARAIDAGSQHQLRLALHCHSQVDAAHRLASEIAGSFVIQADLTSSFERERLVREVLAKGPPHALVNCAGSSTPHETALQISEATFDHLVDVNLKAPLFLMEALGRAMAREGSGVIVNVSSVLARVGVAGSAVYRATKAALEALTKQYAMEFGPRGVRVNAVAPGIVRTAMTEGMDDAMRERFEGMVALGEATGPDSVASAVWQLIENEYLTGVILPVDGGIAL